MSKKVIVTGVTGQDGSYMVDYLLDRFKDMEVYGGVRRLSVDNHDNIEHIDDDRFSLIDLDLTDPYSVQKNIQEIQPDYFVNFAAQSFVGSSWDNPSLTFQVNTMGVMNILESIRLHSPETRLYQAGSSEEFGDVAFTPQDETHPLRPRSPYGASKASARHLIKVYRESYGLYATQGILFNHECFDANTPLILKRGGNISVDYIRRLAPERKNLNNEPNVISIDLKGEGLEVWNGTKFVGVKTITRRKISTLDKKNQNKLYSNSRFGSVTTTPNHKLINKIGDKVEARSVEIGDELKHGSFPKNQTLDTNENFATFLGYLAGDGYVSKRGSIRLTNSNETILEDFKTICKKIFPTVKFNLMESPSGFGGDPVPNLNCSGISSDFGKYVRSIIYCPKTAHKKVPSEILNAGPRAKAAFFDAYYACDGLKVGHQTYKYKSFKTNSPLLAQGILLITREILTQEYNINTFEQNDRIYYQVNFRSDAPTNKGKHLIKSGTELKKVIARNEEENCFVYDIETDCGYLNAGVGSMVVGNSERRGKNFVTQKICRNVARIAKAKENNEGFTPLELGNVDSRRDWSHAEDFIDGVWRMLNQSKVKDYVLSSNETHSVREFVELSFQFVGIQGKWSGTGVDEIFTDESTGETLMVVNPKFYRPAEVELLLGDSTKARQELGWEPKVNFKALVERMMRNQTHSR